MTFCGFLVEAFITKLEECHTGLTGIFLTTCFCVKYQFGRVQQPKEIKVSLIRPFEGPPAFLCHIQPRQQIPLFVFYFQIFFRFNVNNSLLHCNVAYVALLHHAAWFTRDKNIHGNVPVGHLLFRNFLSLFSINMVIK